MLKGRELKLRSIVLIALLCMTPFIDTHSASGLTISKERAIIIVSTITNETSEEQKAVNFYEFLLENGFSEDTISFYASDELDGSDGISNISNIENAFSNMISMHESLDNIIVYISDHEQGVLGHSNFSFIDGLIPTSSISQWIGNINCSEITIILNGNKSGLAGPEIDSPKNIVLSSMMWNQTCDQDYFDIVRSLNDPLSDLNHDGEISYYEAFQNECRILENLSHPQVPNIWK